ncbi:hypothetical protein ACJ8MM_11530 [Lacticaseibacillus paracasei]|uniref:hypothetical protein n=1 Tax=Lacticaseibacillus paracasei TaxID=1597 RepID=UPI0002986C5E|nr:hypothetical protein [Lacticaseibacillus paracasei]AGP67738.1 Hypothetical protein LOCK919_1035 [Lacticaseibacillus paracasei]EKQ23561.1 hypothetical protein LCAUW1_0873 [Lacticaseibacillus paracasei]MEB0327224.1 hypothetical protein [Lacticaseibacillus paracasei]
MNEETESLVPLQARMEMIDAALKEGGLDVYMPEVTSLIQYIDFNEATEFIRFSTDMKLPVFKTVDYAEKERSIYTTDYILDMADVDSLDKVPDILMDKIKQYNDSLSDVDWGEMISLEYMVIKDGVGFRLIYLTDTFFRVNVDLDKQLEDFAKRASFEAHANKVNPSLEQQGEFDKLVNEFVEKVKDDPAFAMTRNIHDRNKFVKASALNDPKLSELFDKINSLGPYPKSGLHSISLALLNEYRNHKKHYDAIRKAHEN